MLLVRQTVRVVQSDVHSLAAEATEIYCNGFHLSGRKLSFTGCNEAGDDALGDLVYGVLEVLTLTYLHW